MKYRVKNLMEALSVLPPPKREGEILQASIYSETFEVPYVNDKDLCNQTFQYITVEAQWFMSGKDSSLEWVLIS